MTPERLFFCGIGGSGMLPLALIAQGQGARVSGSDRSRDQGRTPEKFRYLEDRAMTLFPQDGSGVRAGVDRVVVSTAVEDSIPDIRAAQDLGIPIVHRSALLAEMFNKAERRVAIAGTSGKTTTTGMAGYILREAGLNPTVMNGGVFRNYADEDPYCSALVGDGRLFVTEADESDGSIARYNPTVAVLNNIALDHKPMEELVPLFREYLAGADKVVLNFDSDAVRALAAEIAPEKIISYAMAGEADVTAENTRIELQVPGQYNVANALAAIGVAVALGMKRQRAADILQGFTGIRRRMETIGMKSGVTVIDDFAHNPDKIAASLAALREREGRLFIFFQPHGYGFLKLLKDDLAACFSQGLRSSDYLWLVEPYYAGGTVDRSIGSSDVAQAISGPHASVAANRETVKMEMLEQVHAGDRIVVMGARDDTLAEFARELYRDLA